MRICAKVSQGGVPLKPHLDIELLAFEALENLLESRKTEENPENLGEKHEKSWAKPSKSTEIAS